MGKHRGKLVTNIVILAALVLTISSFPIYLSMQTTAPEAELINLNAYGATNVYNTIMSTYAPNMCQVAMANAENCLAGAPADVIAACHNYDNGIPRLDGISDLQVVINYLLAGTFTCQVLLDLCYNLCFPTGTSPIVQTPGGGNTGIDLWATWLQNINDNEATIQSITHFQAAIAQEYTTAPSLYNGIPPVTQDQLAQLLADIKANYDFLDYHQLNAFGALFSVFYDGGLNYPSEYVPLNAMIYSRGHNYHVNADGSLGVMDDTVPNGAQLVVLLWNGSTHLILKKPLYDFYNDNQLSQALALMNADFVLLLNAALDWRSGYPIWTNVQQNWRLFPYEGFFNGMCEIIHDILVTDGLNPPTRPTANELFWLEYGQLILIVFGMVAVIIVIMIFVNTASKKLFKLA